MKIEPNIPIPKKVRSSKYPFATMRIGDSFHVPFNDRGKVSTAASLFSKYNGGRFTVLKFNDAYRCWKVE